MGATGKSVIVIGTPRSGTSLTSAVFARLGYHIGTIGSEWMRSGDEGNPFGYFEADDLIERNVALFRRAGYREHNTWLSDPITDEQIRSIAQLKPSEADRRWVEEYEKNAPWLWKEPRLTLTLGYWWQLVDPERTAVVVLNRDIDESVLSFQRLHWIGDSAYERDEIRRRILQHRRAAEEAIERHGLPHIQIDFGDYFLRPAEVAKRLSEWCGVDIGPGDLNVKPELNHGSFRGRLSTWLRARMNRTPIRQLRVLQGVLPERLVTLLFPEKKHSGSS